MTYQTYVFDCDGVILDSNPLKTEAFRKVGLPYGEDAAQQLVEHHVTNGGISRFAKFRHFLDHIVPAGRSGPSFDELLANYTSAVREALTTCPLAPGLEQLRERTKGSRWLIVSGGSQEELRDVFAARGIANWFDGGIFGSPDNKDQILSREMACGNIAGRTLFIGDSTYDYQAATNAGLDFVFASYWTEVVDWQGFTQSKNIQVISDISEISNTNLVNG